MATVSAPEVPLYLTEHIKYFSDWFRAKRSVALCLHYLRKLKKHSQERRRSSGDENPVTHRKEVGSESYVPITVEELQSAEAVIIRAAQAASFKKEIDFLSKKEELPEDKHKALPESEWSSNLKKLDPFIDEHGIMRTGGHIRRANLTDEVKFPALLPRNSHITKLVINYFHERCLHQGRTTTLNELRSSGYWVIGGSSSVSHCIHNCVKCCKMRGPPSPRKCQTCPKTGLNQHRRSPIVPWTSLVPGSLKKKEKN